MEVPLWNWEVKYDWCFREAVSKKGHFNCCVLSALPLLQNFLDVAFTAGSMTSLKITSSKVLMVSGVFGEGAKEQQHSGRDRRAALPCGLRNALTVPAAGKPLGKGGFQTCVSLPERCCCPHACWGNPSVLRGSSSNRWERAEMVMENDSCASCRAQRRIIFFPRLPTETSCLNKNDMAGEQTCSPKGEGCVVLEGNITFLCSGMVSCLPCAAWACSAPGFVPPLSLLPLEKQDALAAPGSLGVPVPPQGFRGSLRAALLGREESQM